MLAFGQHSFAKHTAVERAVHRDLVKPGIWPVEIGAAFSWLVTLRSTGDYGGEEHVQPEDAKAAAEKARLILKAARDAAPEPLENLHPLEGSVGTLPDEGAQERMEITEEESEHTNPEETEPPQN